MEALEENATVGQPSVRWLFTGMSIDAPGGEILVYEAADGGVRDTVWLTQDQMSQLFGRERSVVTKHVRNVFREGGAGGWGNMCKICTGSD